jgi:CubicO group peptidase (beta-lactamase class C family)
MKDELLKVELNMVPANLDDGWLVSSPGDVGFDEHELQVAYDKFFSENDLVTGLSLLVVKENQLVAEGYCRGISDHQVKRNIQSATKSFTSLAFGIAMELGYFESVDQRLYDLIPEYFDDDLQKREITIRHLLTMTSGLDFEDFLFAEEVHIQSRKGILEYILSKPMKYEPGTQYWYQNCEPQLLAEVIHLVTGYTIEELAAEFLFEPMGIENYVWDMNEDGTNWAAYGLFLTPRDMAKIGKLVLNNGNWEGEQLISSSWIEQSTAYHIDFAIPGQELNSPPGYGYYWWVYGQDFAWLPGIDAISAVGVGGQYIFIMPDMELVIVMTGEPGVSGENNIERDFFPLAEMIINAVID